MSICYVNRYFLGPAWLTISPPFLGIAPFTPQSYAGMGPFSHVCIPWSCPPGHRLLSLGWTHVYWFNQILYARNLEFETERHRAWEPMELSCINVSTFKRAIHQLPLRSPWRSPDSYSSQPWSPWDNLAGFPYKFLFALLANVLFLCFQPNNNNQCNRIWDTVRLWWHKNQVKYGLCPSATSI